MGTFRLRPTRARSDRGCPHPFLTRIILMNASAAIADSPLRQAWPCKSKAKNLSAARRSNAAARASLIWRAGSPLVTSTDWVRTGTDSTRRRGEGCQSPSWPKGENSAKPVGLTSCHPVILPWPLAQPTRLRKPRSPLVGFCSGLYEYHWLRWVWYRRIRRP